MAKNTNQQKPQPASPKKATPTKAATIGVLDRIDNWLQQNDKKVFYTLLFLSTLFSLLLFDSKVSDGGDDSSYIERAWSLLKDGKFPYFQGPGYPVALSLFVKIFGLKVIALKFFSVLCQFGFVWITYISFSKRVPYLVLFALLAFLSFNNFIQYYASQTFTETFFLFVQSICIYITFKIIDAINTEDSLLQGFKNNYGKWLLFGFMFVMLAISKSVGFVAIGGVLAYFLFTKNYKQILYAVVMFLLFRTLYQLITTAAFGPNETNQLEMMLRKHLYYENQGHEDFSGMIDRFFNNFNTYISLHIYRILNLRAFDYKTEDIIPSLSFLSTVIMGVFAVLSFRKNKFIFFSGLYLAALCGGIFLGVQSENMQDRLIIIAMPFVYLVLFNGTYMLVKRSAYGQTLLLIFSVIMLLKTVGISSMKAKDNVTALKKNLSGDIYYGFTPDWTNFLKMSKYCGDSLPANVGIVSRKPSMSFIYGNGRKFVGQFTVITTKAGTVDADTVLAAWKKSNVKYVIRARLRQNPKKQNGEWINTIDRMLQPINEKYPQKLRVVKTIGDEEQCELFEINY